MEYDSKATSQDLFDFILMLFFECMLEALDDSFLHIDSLLLLLFILFVPFNNLVFIVLQDLY